MDPVRSAAYPKAPRGCTAPTRKRSGRAKALAEQEQTDLWYTEDHHTFTLVRSFRHPTQSA